VETTARSTRSSSVKRNVLSLCVVCVRGVGKRGMAKGKANSIQVAVVIKQWWRAKAGAGANTTAHVAVKRCNPRGFTLTLQLLHTLPNSTVQSLAALLVEKRKQKTRRTRSRSRSRSQREKWRTRDDECALCFISMVDPPDQVVMDLLCFHSYHRRCVSDWRDHCKSKQVPLSCPMQGYGVREAFCLRMEGKGDERLVYF